MGIPSDKIVMVTGDPRSGTSLMMQTLISLGVPVAGEEFPGTLQYEKLRNLLKEEKITQEEFDERSKDSNKREEKMKEMNPGGFYEIPGVVMRGLEDIDEHGGKAIKIISPGAYIHDNMGTPPEIVNKYILCLRNPRDVAQSQTNLTRPIAQLIGIDNPSWAIDPSRYLYENGGLAGYLSSLEDRSKWLLVDYDGYLNAPADTIDNIIEHLAISSTEEQRQNAIDNVNPDLNRSRKAFEGWEGREIRGMIADQLYDSIKTSNWAAIPSINEQIKAEKEKDNLEKSRWYDKSIGLIVGASWHRIAIKKPEIMTTRLEQYRREILRNMHPMSSPKFKESVSAEEYTIKRPADFGNLIRRKVLYDGKLMTWEECFISHQNLWQAGKSVYDRSLIDKILETI